MNVALTPLKGNPTTVGGAPSSNSTWMEYVRLTRFHWFLGGADIVVVFPALWGLAMAAYEKNLDPQSLAIYSLWVILGGTLLNSAGCVINDIADVDFDRQVSRCQNRPLAAGTVSMTGAWILLCALTVPVLAMLWMTNEVAFLWGFVGVIPLPWLYPFMKRWTWWPQAWLGLAVNWGFITTWLVITGEPNWGLFGPGYIGGFFWTIVYDTIYACQDRKDDRKAGVKTTALLFGSWVRPILSIFAAIFVCCLIFAGYCNSQGICFYVVTSVGAILFFGWTFSTWCPDDPVDCGEKFTANGNFGYIIWGAIILDYCAKRYNPTLFASYPGEMM